MLIAVEYRQMLPGADWITQINKLFVGCAIKLNSFLHINDICHKINIFIFASRN